MFPCLSTLLSTFLKLEGIKRWEINKIATRKERLLGRAICGVGMHPPRLGMSDARPEGKLLDFDQVRNWFFLRTTNADPIYHVMDGFFPIDIPPISKIPWLSLFILSR